MPKVYFPTSMQVDTTNNQLVKMGELLEMIPDYDEYDISTWANIQQAVRDGVARYVLPIGTQLTVSHSVYGDMLYDVVAHDHYKSANDPNAHTMTLLCHDALPTSVIFSEPAALYYADEALSPGTHKFVLDTSFGGFQAGTYSFTLPGGLPQGGQLCMQSWSNGEIGLYLYLNATQKTPIPVGDKNYAVVTYSSSKGDSDFQVTLGQFARQCAGNGNYKESFIRQFLNSSAEDVRDVWTPYSTLNRYPMNWHNTAGFMNGLDEEFLAVVGEVIIPCISNNSYEYPESDVNVGERYTLTDKFYLPSVREIVTVLGENLNYLPDDGSTLFPYYRGAKTSDYIKYQNGVAKTWATRSISNYSDYSDGYHPSGTICRFSSNGNYYAARAATINGIAPACTIV